MPIKSSTDLDGCVFCSGWRNYLFFSIFVFFHTQNIFSLDCYAKLSIRFEDKKKSCCVWGNRKLFLNKNTTTYALHTIGAHIISISSCTMIFFPSLSLALLMCHFSIGSGAIHHTSQKKEEERSLFDVKLCWISIIVREKFFLLKFLIV